MGKSLLKECQKVAIICQDLVSADDLLHNTYTEKSVPSAIFCLCSDIFTICLGVFNKHMFTSALARVEMFTLAQVISAEMWSQTVCLCDSTHPANSVEMPRDDQGEQAESQPAHNVLVPPGVGKNFSNSEPAASKLSLDDHRYCSIWNNFFKKTNVHEPGPIQKNLTKRIHSRVYTKYNSHGISSGQWTSGSCGDDHL